MKWFYAVGSERLGPISDQQLSNLIANDTVSETTLVWREGFASWQAWSEVAAANSLPQPDASAPPIPVTPVADESEEGPELDWSIDEFEENLRQNGFATSVGGCLSRAWENYKSFFWLALGTVLVASIISFVAGMLPLVGLFAGILVAPHTTAGAVWLFLKRARGEEVEFSDVFTGFSRCYGKLAVVGLIQFVATMALVVAFVVPLLGMGLTMDGLNSGKPPEILPEAAAGMAAMGFVAFVFVVFLAVRFCVSHIAAIDRADSAINAFRFSWRITKGRFFTILGLGIILFLLCFAGMLALLIGLVFVLPMYGAIVAQIYHDACESAAGRPPE
ncbi:MAG: DUF4339 domain-containing protein [Opitutaceae bacterium]|tara:strand:+ start:13387 stop:14382 length:996 start_codon:yes stop_codon:yes gene_type:complete